MSVIVKRRPFGPAESGTLAFSVPQKTCCMVPMTWRLGRISVNGLSAGTLTSDLPEHTFPAGMVKVIFVDEAKAVAEFESSTTRGLFTCTSKVWQDIVGTKASTSP